MSGNDDAWLRREALSCSDCQQGVSHYVPPDLGEDHFTCPSCGQHAWQTHLDLYSVIPDSPDERPAKAYYVVGFAATQCNRCNKYTLWHEAESYRPIYPSRTLLPPPSPSMPDYIAREYEEARSTYSGSARACVALLGLVLEMLLREAGVLNPDMHSALLELKQRGQISANSLPHATQFHPGVIRRSDEDGDDQYTAQLLCRIINEFVEKSSNNSEAAE